MPSEKTRDVDRTSGSAPDRPTVPRGGGASGPDSLGELVSSVSTDLSTLVRDEIALAKAEVRVEVKNAALGAALFVVAGLLGVVVFLFVSVTFAELLTLVLPRWAGYAIVALVYALLAGVLALLGKNRVSKVGPPERTVRTIKDDVAWAKNPTQAAQASAARS